MSAKENDKIREKGIKRLRKLCPIYVLEKRNDYWGRKYKCLYRERGIAKLAFIPERFYIRYGPSVLATLKKPSPTSLWQSSKDLISEEEYEYLCKLVDEKQLDLDLLDPEKLKYHS